MFFGGLNLQVGELKGSTVLRHDLFTNDVLYTEVAFNMRTVKAELLPLVPLFWYLSSTIFLATIF